MINAIKKFFKNEASSERNIVIHKTMETTETKESMLEAGWVFIKEKGDYLVFTKDGIRKQIKL